MKVETHKRFEVVWGKHALHLASLAVLLVASFLLIHSDMPTMRAATSEIGDYAMYSIFVQDAKHFDLLHGNPSRVGFYHPGPALMYMLAFGEGVFHDWLHWVPSPIAGQLVGVALYNAMWIALAFLMLVRIAGSMKLGVLGFGIFMIVSALQVPDFFRGIWFPYLYFFPFAVFTLAIARLIDGRADALPVMALALGVLINGHACFIPVCGVISVMALVVNQVATRATPSKRLLSRKFIVVNRFPVAVAVALLLFLVSPILIASIVNFPGPIVGYLHYGEHHSPNGVSETLSYMSSYFGGRAEMVSAVLAAGCVWALTRNAPEGAPIRSATIALFLVTVAMFIYTRYGIDQLGEAYIGLFYFSVAGILSALLLIASLHAQRHSLKSGGVLVMAFALIGGAYHIQNRPLGDASQFNHPKVALLYQALKAIKGKGTLVLNLSQGRDWVPVWTRVIAVEAYAKRRNVALFCINDGWNIIFSRAARCKAADRGAAGHTLFVQASSAPVPAGMDIAAHGMGLAFYRFSTITDKGDITVAKNRSIFVDTLLGDGWSHPEADFVWTDARSASLYLPMREGFTGSVDLDLSAFLPRADMSQQLEIKLDGRVLLTASFTEKTKRQQLAIPIRNLGHGGATLDIVVAHPFSPKAWGVSNDTRTLGVSLYGVEVKTN